MADALLPLPDFLDEELFMQLITMSDGGDTSFLAECAVMFEEAFASTLPKLRASLADARCKDATAEAHFLGSTAGTMGCMQLLKLCRLVEAKSLANEIAPARAAFAEAEAHYAVVVAWLRSKALLS
eukprot:a510984_183.p2 GENE.a510984_183~~a510984_183.p2  ORF type:complete len:135 (-),score=37.91 a510984_183:55-432(-)